MICVIYAPILSNSLVCESSSIICTIDDPIITPSEQSANNFASSSDLIPNPANTGTEACFFISSIFVLISLTSRFEAPVTPLKVT